VLQRKTDLLDGPFVRKRLLPWPPEPLRIAAGYGMRAVLQAEDRVREAPLRRMQPEPAPPAPVPTGAAR
jgi:hypothetical protein